jgi:hypothetical protein
MQHFLKAVARAARARIVAAELLLQPFVAVDDAQAALDLPLRRKPPSTLIHRLKSAKSRPDRILRTLQ